MDPVGIDLSGLQRGQDEDSAMNVMKKIRKQKGTSLIELMLAMLVLGVGLVGSAAMTAVSIKSNSRSKNDSMSTAVAKMVIGQISAVPIGGAAVNITDCAGNTTAVTTTGTTSGAGASLTSSGIVDYTQSFSGVPTGYAMKYTACNTVNGTKAVYDVRWNITSIGSPAKEELVVVGARFLGTSSNAQLFAPAVDLRTVVGNQGE
jgi:prepilin-type N-terminal cleavage/methylation domain-containing protein